MFMENEKFEAIGSRVEACIILMRRGRLPSGEAATSNIYMHSEDERRHDKTNAAHRLNWENPLTHRASTGKP